jgi:hypothetical protein
VTDQIHDLHTLNFSPDLPHFSSLSKDSRNSRRSSQAGTERSSRDTELLRALFDVGEADEGAGDANHYDGEDRTKADDDTVAGSLREWRRGKRGSGHDREGKEM